MGLALLIVAAVMVFNYVYLLGLLVVRCILPRPKEGLHQHQPGEWPSWPILLFMLNLLVLKRVLIRRGRQCSRRC